MSQFVNYIAYISFTVLGGILGYFIRILIEHRLAIDRIKENIKITEFNKAAALFREAFVMEIFLLRENIDTGDQ